jgi:hypothetical protein
VSVIGRTGTLILRWAVVFLLAGLSALATGGVSAQQRSLIDPDTAQLRRELRSIEGRLESSPRSARIQLNRARRALIREGRGVSFTPEQGRIARDLDRLGRELRQVEREPRREPRDRPIENNLPRSYDDPPTASGGSNNLVTVTRLLIRAEAALEQGRTVQAQSDLAAARGFLGGVRPEPPAATRRAELERRLQDLEERAAASGG